MMLLRFLFVIFASASGFLVTLQFLDERLSLIGLFGGLIISILAILFAEKVKNTPLRVVLGGSLGLIIGLIVANLFIYPIVMKYFNNTLPILTIYFLTNCIIGYIGLSIGTGKGDDIESWASNLGVIGGGTVESRDRMVKIIDTSVIIDGRIADICDTGFVEGTLVIPQFVLGELQYIADSSEPIKRAKGKRGLDILQRLQKHSGVEVEITDKDYPKIKEVDAKLVALAKESKGKILTNDQNLYKIAELQGVSVLNINELANSLKPVVMPGEAMNILVIKEGKEHGQGVGYLDDGTMVVIDNARKLLGKNVDVLITSILQTASGRMIFSRLREEAKGEFAYANAH